MENKNVLIINKEIYNFVNTIKGANLTAPKEWRNEQVWKEISTTVSNVLTKIAECYGKDKRIEITKRIITVVIMRETFGFYGLSAVSEDVSVHDQFVNFNMEQIIPSVWDCLAVIEHQFITNIICNEFVMQQITTMLKYEAWNFEKANHLPLQ